MKQGGTIRVVLIALYCASLVLITVSLPATGNANALLPDIDDIGHIAVDRSLLWSPGRLAVGAKGTLYVADGYRNHILQFDAYGNYSGDIKFPKVSAIAVSSDGTLYIGSYEDYAVSVVKDGEIIGYLGNGLNEFRSMRDIAIDEATGYIYVADQAGNAVRIFDSAGRDLGKIEGVNLPVSVDITDDRIYIIDAPIIEEEEGSLTASRISIFDKAYNLVGTIDDYEKHTMFHPTDLTVADGILYVTDAALSSVLLFDTTGTFHGEIQSVDSDISRAVGLAISPDGIIYVSSSRKQSIQMFAITAKNGVRTTPDTSGY